MSVGFNATSSLSATRAIKIIEPSERNRREIRNYRFVDPLHIVFLGARKWRWQFKRRTAPRNDCRLELLRQTISLQPVLLKKYWKLAELLRNRYPIVQSHRMHTKNGLEYTLNKKFQQNWLDLWLETLGTEESYRFQPVKNIENWRGLLRNRYPIVLTVQTNKLLEKWKLRLNLDNTI